MFRQGTVGALRYVFVAPPGPLGPSQGPGSTLEAT